MDKLQEWIDSIQYNLDKEYKKELYNHYKNNPPVSGYKPTDYPEGVLTISVAYSIVTSYCLVSADYVRLFPTTIPGWYFAHEMFVGDIEKLENMVNKKRDYKDMIFLTPDEIKKLITIDEEIHEESERYAEDLLNCIYYRA